jgi:hypothetical protein
MYVSMYVKGLPSLLGQISICVYSVKEKVCMNVCMRRGCLLYRCGESDDAGRGIACGRRGKRGGCARFAYQSYEDDARHPDEYCNAMVRDYVCMYCSMMVVVEVKPFKIEHFFPSSSSSS